MTTSVVYDGTLPEGSPRVEQIREIVAGATGYDEERGDNIEVKGILFDRSHEIAQREELDRIKEEMEMSKGFFGRYKDLIVAGIMGVLAIGILILVARFLFSKKKEAEIIALEEAFEKQREIDNISEDIERIGGEKIEVTVDTDERKAKNYAKENPDLAADLIKVWLKNQ